MEDWREDPEEDNETSNDICLRPPWGSKWTENVGDLRPIKGDETHSQTALITKHLVYDDVVWDDPAYPGEVAESLEKITWEKVPAQATDPNICEESATRETSMISHARICLGVQSIKERAVNQVGGPDWKVGSGCK